LRAHGKVRCRVESPGQIGITILAQALAFDALVRAALGLDQAAIGNVVADGCKAAEIVL